MMPPAEVLARAISPKAASFMSPLSSSVMTNGNISNSSGGGGNAGYRSSKFDEKQSEHENFPCVLPNVERNYHNREENILGCNHYQRACKLRAECCGLWFSCRFCHDEMSDHEIDRFATKAMLCMYCSTAQPVGQNCCNCQKQIARYFCSICKLWDNDHSKPIYHCDKCNLCRTGLQKDYFHCDKCNACLDISLFNNHKCIERTLECDCPICHEYLFTSVAPVIFMPCSHAIHYKCHEELTRTSYQCPLCWKSLGNMKHLYSAIDEMLAEHKMPEEYANLISTILCNDCEMKSDTSYHFLYHKCQYCASYNTKVLRTTSAEHQETK